MCDPELISFGNVSAVYICENRYLLGTVEPTSFGYELVPLPGMPYGGIDFEGGTVTWRPYLFLLPFLFALPIFI